MDDEKFMRQALEEARKGIGQTSPNPPVGAVIVNPEGEVLGSGHHQKAGEPHAEINAIADVLKNHPAKTMSGSTLYVTLEPCSTEGKTGACTDSILDHQFGRVVIGTPDPNPEHAGRGVALLNEAGIETTAGVCERQSKELIRFFTKHITTGRPFLIAKSAITLDGRTALPSDRGPWITGSAARNDVQHFRSLCDAILVGGETIRRDNPRLTLRHEFAMTERPQPWRVILTASKDLPEDALVFNDDNKDRTMVFHGSSLARALEELGKLGICSVLMESGGRLFSQALANGLIDEVILYVAPIIGGQHNRLMPADNLVTDLDGMKVKRFGRDIRISGYPRNTK